MKNNKIFVSMAAIDDEELFHTVSNAFANADYPERVFFGIHLSYSNNKIKKSLESIAKKHKSVKYSLSVQKKNNIDTLGVGLGRSKAFMFYNQEDYVLQIDCHSYLDKSWDTKLIKIFSEAIVEIGDDRLVVTAIPPIYSYGKDEQVQKIGPKTRCSYFKTDSLFANSVPEWGEFDSLDSINKKFLPSVKVNSACIFGNHNFAEDPGIHSAAIFYDEEITQTYNLFARGIALVFPNFENFPVRHLDGNMMTKGHHRSFFLDYLDEKSNLEIHERLRNNYLKFVEDPQNKEKIEIFKKYSKVDPKRGYFLREQPFIPKKYRIEE
jgi:hypothetical protein